MTSTDFEAFSARLVTMAELFDAQLSESKLVLYFEALADLELPDVLAACLVAVKSCTFMPKPAELRRLIVGDDEDAVERAWLTYKRLARSIGGYQSVELDAALALTLDSVFGGWEQACWTDLSPEMWAAKRKEFGRVYRVFADRAYPGQRRLNGFVDRENRLRGFDTSARLAGGDQKQLTDGDDRA